MYSKNHSIFTYGFTATHVGRYTSSGKDCKIMKSTRTILAISLILSALVATIFVSAQSAIAKEKLTCAILDNNFCATADNDIPKGTRANSSNSAIFMILEWALGVLTAGIGVVAIGAFVYAGIMYSSAGGNSEQIKKAKEIMMQTVIGLVIFAAMGVVLMWLIPGGIF